MTRGVKVRLMAFLVLSAVGIVYVASSFLGITDRLLGRGLSIEATLPASGGLFTGSEVTYRGVKVGKVSAMDVTPDGLRVRLALEDGTKIPLDSKMYVHNLSAVGEQYLDFEPPDNDPPYAKNGDVIKGDESSLPTSEELLLTQMNSLVDVARRRRAVHGDRRGRHDVPRHGEPAAAHGRLRHAVRRRGGREHRLHHHACSTPAAPCCRRRPTTRQDIRTFARDLADLTGTLRTSDKNIRTILQGGPPAVREVNSLLKGLEPTLPVFLSNLVTTNQVLTANIPALEQMLVVFPHVIAAGFTGTPGDGYGHINLQFNNNVPALHQGLQAAVPVAPGHRHHRRADLPGQVQVRPAHEHARLQLRAEVRVPPASPGRAYRVVDVRCEDGRGRHRRRSSRWSSAPEEDCARCSVTMDGSGC